MKVLFAAYRSDPRDPAAAGGAEYQFYRGLAGRGVDLEVLPPARAGAHPLERLIRRVYRSASGRSYLKYTWSSVSRASGRLTRAASTRRPDVVLTLFPAPLVFYSADAPCVYRLDTTFRQLERDGAEFLRAGDLALAISLWQERRALDRSAVVVTHSERSRRFLVEDYGVASDRIEVFPNPSSLPSEVRAEGCADQRLEIPLRLLLVGRDARRKGVDVAIEVVDQLDQIGIPASLTVCGLDGEATARVRFAGTYDKTDPGQLDAYVGHYTEAHFLLHPARFDASPMVTSEAAAFGLPTLTHDVGGMATAVIDGDSGVVLPRGSAAEDYVKVILFYLRRPERYLELRRATLRRYRRELDWEQAAPRLLAALERAAGTRRQR